MTIEELLEGIEGTMVEFKQEDSKEFYRSLAALANGPGGVVLLGVTDAKEISGFRCTDKSIRELTETIVNKLQIHPTITPIEIDGRDIVRIDVRPSRTPISLNGRYPKRVGNTTRDMLPDELKDFFLASIQWDALPNEIPLSAIHEPTVRMFLSLAQQNGRLNVTAPNEPVELVLGRLGLIRDGMLTNAAVLLFGERPQELFPAATTRVGRFRTETEIAGDRWIDGNLFVQLSKGEEAIREFIIVRYEISEKAMRTGLARREIWDYPLVALREALVNALVHRDYLRQNQQTVIKVYDDRIWFYNPGGLPNGLTVERLLAEPQSIPRNPLIAKVMYLAGSIEQYGTGMARIIEASGDAGLPRPTISESAQNFSLILKKELFPTARLRGMGLSDRQIMAVDRIKSRGSLTSGEYQELISRSKRVAYMELTYLVDLGILIREGAGRSTRYVLRDGD
jgi:ATP-dependent DNA helicase RecG